MKIKRSILSRYRNEEHFQHLREINTVIQENGVVGLEGNSNLTKAYGVFTGLIEKEEKAIEIVRKNEYTADVVEAGHSRGNMYVGMHLHVRSCLHHPEKDKVKAAQKIQNVLNHYGQVYKKPYNQQTAMIYNLVQELNENFAMEIHLIKADEWIENLRKANEKFARLVGLRHNDKAKYAELNIREIRKEIDTVYNGLIDYFNFSLKVDMEGKLTKFANEMNERIDYYNNTLAMRQIRNRKKISGTSSRNSEVDVS